MASDELNVSGPFQHKERDSASFSADRNVAIKRNKIYTHGSLEILPPEEMIPRVSAFK